MAPVPAFVRAVLYGALAAAAPVLVVTVTLGIASMLDGGWRGDGKLAPSLWLAVLPLVVTLPLVLAASLLVGLPLTMLLRRFGRESELAYTTCGAVAGCLIPIGGLLAMAAPSGHWTALLGAFGGAVTGRTWWSAARTRDVRQTSAPRAPDGEETLS